MDLQVPQVPGIEIVYAQQQETNQSPSTSGKRNEVSPIENELDKLLSKAQLKKSRSSSSGDDSLGSFREITNTTDSIIHDLKETLHTFHLKNIEDHLEIFQHIEKVNAERKISTEFNQQMREDIGLLKTKIDNIEKLYKILNDSLSTAQQSEALRKQKESITTQQELAQLLQKIDANANLHIGIKEQYNDLKTQFDELCIKLAQNPTSSPLLTTIMSTSRLREVTPGIPKDTADQMTLEDILTQLQAEIIVIGKRIQQLENASKDKSVDEKISAFQKIIDDLNSKVITVENNNESRVRRAFFLTTGSILALLAGFLFWWQTHKA